MESINTYILEKLKLSKNNKHINHNMSDVFGLITKICWLDKTNFPQARKVIADWIDNNDIKSFDNIKCISDYNQLRKSGWMDHLEKENLDELVIDDINELVDNTLSWDDVAFKINNQYIDLKILVNKNLLIYTYESKNDITESIEILFKYNK